MSLAKNSDEQNSNHHNAPGNHESTPRHEESATVLIIDDEPTVLDVTRQMLQRMGHKVLLATNGTEALSVVQKYRGEIHVALLDLGMPVLDGSETFPELHRLRPDMAVIICSGYDLDATARSVLDAGARAFLHKPFQMQSLSREIQSFLKKKSKFARAT